MEESVEKFFAATMIFSRTCATFAYILNASYGSGTSIYFLEYFITDGLDNYFNEKKKSPVFKWMIMNACDSVLSLVKRKPVFGVCDQVRQKPACAATDAK